MIKKKYTKTILIRLRIYCTKEASVAKELNCVV